jgi:hypothetical protein
MELIYDFIMLINCELNYDDISSPLALYHCLLYFAVYFKNNSVFFNEVCNVVITGLVRLLDFFYDKNVIPFSNSLRTQINNGLMFQEILDVLKKNLFPVVFTDIFADIERRVILSHFANQRMVLQSSLLPLFGNTSSTIWSKQNISSVNECFLKPESNITVLKDGVTYISINTGNEIYSKNRHADQCSFTFYYDGIANVIDSGTKKTTKYPIPTSNQNLLNYLSCQTAHSALIVDDLDYEYEPYVPFTTIKTVTEHKDYIIVRTGHELYSGVNIQRTFLWVKSNVLILFDSAESAVEHSYTQNYIISLFTSRSDGENYIEIKRSNKHRFRITQYEAGYDLKDFNGVIPFDVENPRGVICENGVTPKSAYNLAYTKHGKTVKFLTVLEAHSGKPNEISVHSVNTKGSVLCVELTNGTIIEEKMG